ncbi:hypothetical protein WR25_17051 [Diploscapter pachys]|uniref:Uncharacterized protein n=1 Tax=Diploscapter pachys TaxID=2018661 RepID=A0A2A2LWN8_9BILA|nr:hypothetical protein WR25_17051 [Diploscapter pachys]
MKGTDKFKNVTQHLLKIKILMNFLFLKSCIFIFIHKFLSIQILYEDSKDGNINFNDVLRIKENFGLNTSQILKKFRDRRRYVETTVMKALVQLKVTRLDDYRLDSIVQITKQTRKIVENTLKKFKEKIIEKISKVSFYGDFLSFDDIKNETSSFDVNIGFMILALLFERSRS